MAYTDDFDTGLRSERQLADIEEQANAPQVPTEPDPGVFVRKDTLTTKGDLYAATSAATVGRQPLGTNGQVLTVDTTTSTGLKYATPTTGTVTGSGAAGRVAFWDSASNITSDADLTFATDTLTFTKGVASTNLTIGGGSALTSSGAGGTVATLAGAEELTNKTLNASVGKGTWTASGTWTLPAHTLAGSISGGGQTITNLASVALRDTSAAFDVTIGATSSTALGAARSLTLDVANASRTLKLTGNPTIADWFDQSVKTTAAVTHADLLISTAAATVARVVFQPGGATKGFWGVAGAANDLISGSAADDGLFRSQGGSFLFSVDSGSSAAVRINKTSFNVKLGASNAVRGTTEGTNHLDIFDGTAPVGTLTNGISLYSTSGELRVMDSAGNATLLSPHDDEGNWIHDEVNCKGRRLRVDMERMILALDRLLGGGFVTVEEKES